MSLVLRIVTTEDFDLPHQVYFDEVSSSLGLSDGFEVLKSEQYWKMPQRTEFLLESRGGPPSLDKLSKSIGEKAVLETDLEAIFDESQGSKIFFPKTYWVHAECVD